MLNLTFGQTIGNYDAISAANLPTTQKGLGVITVCLRVGNCLNELYIDLVIGYTSCPKLINTKLSYRLSATQPLQAQADNITREISSLIPDVAIAWTSVLTATQFTLTGTVTGSVPISGSVYGNSVSTINFTYANPVALTTQNLVPGTPYLLNVGTYPTPTPATNILGINQVSSGIVAGGLACAPGAPPTPATTCPDVLQTFPSFVGVVGASKGSCGSNCQEIITRGTVKIKLGEIANPGLYVANNWTLPYLYINATTRQFAIRYLSVNQYILGIGGYYTIGQVRTLEVTPFTATIIL
jgi:hypothetical protein